MGEVVKINPHSQYLFDTGKATGAANFARYLMKDMNGEQALQLHKQLCDFLESEGL